MALRAVFPRGHDQVKGNVFRALVPHEELDLQRQLPLGDPFPDVGRICSKAASVIARDASIFGSPPET